MGSPQAVIFDTYGLLLDTDRMPVAQVEAVSVCAGQGQNLISALAEHGGDIRRNNSCGIVNSQARLRPAAQP
jgi:hypothetical protein